MAKFFDQPINSNIKTYENIRKIATGKGDDYTTGCLLDYSYFQDYYKMIAIDLNKQQAVDADPRTIQQINFFFSIWVFFHKHSRITGLQGKGEGISLTPHYHFHPLHRQLDISRAITAESSPRHIASSRTRIGNLWFPSASR